MIRSVVTVTLFLAGIAITTAASAANLERGKSLYENHCVGCHDDTVHKRDAHKAKNIADIKTFVARWEKAQGLKWGEEERSDVASYVNSKFYNY